MSSNEGLPLFERLLSRFSSRTSILFSLKTPLTTSPPPPSPSAPSHTHSRSSASPSLSPFPLLHHHDHAHSLRPAHHARARYSSPFPSHSCPLDHHRLRCRRRRSRYLKRSPSRIRKKTRRRGGGRGRCSRLWYRTESVIFFRICFLLSLSLSRMLWQRR